MTKIKTRALWLICCVLLLSVPADAGIDWIRSYKKGIAESRKTGKPAMIDIYANWCGWCKKLDRDVFTNKKVIELSKQFVCIKVNGDSDRKTAKKYNVRGYPAIRFINKDEKVIGRISGYAPASSFATEMKSALRKHGPVVVPAAIKKLEKKFKKAQKAKEQEDYQAAIKSFSGVAGANVAHDFVGQAKEMLDEINSIGLERLNEADTFLEKEEYEKAVERLVKVSETFRGVEVGEAAERELADLKADPKFVAKMKEIATSIEKAEQEAKAKLFFEKAEKLENHEEYQRALNIYDKIAGEYSATTISAKAEERAEGIRSDEDLMIRIADEAAKKECRGWLRMAKLYETNDKDERAIGYYQRIIDEFPDSSYAETARTAIARLSE